jgi:hypothetical protein
LLRSLYIPTLRAGKLYKELYMKNLKFLGFLAFSFLAVLLAGCFNPIPAIPPKTDDSVIDPFTVDIFIGKDGSVRTVMGPDSSMIKDDIRNIFQLIVVDKDDDNDKPAIVAFDEYRRPNKEETAATLSIDSIAFGKKYDFLLLMGHWERETNEGDDFIYKETPPTLLAAGLIKQMTVTESGKLTAMMWPIVVDTEFTTKDENIPIASQTAAPDISPWKPVSLFPVGWTVTWRVLTGSSGDGFAILQDAQAAVGASDLFKDNGSVIVNGSLLEEVHPVVKDNVITYFLDTYTSGIGRLGTSGSVNFNLKYVPFNLTDDDSNSNPWAAYTGKSKFDLSGTNTPEWIIRNGVNDEAQNEKTNFNAFHHFVGEGDESNDEANGNGAVSFVIAAEGPPGGGTPANPEDPYPPYDPNNPPGSGALVIKDGKFEGLKTDSSTEAHIGFTTAGYEDDAEVYYAVVDGGAVNGPKYSAYTRKLDNLKAKTHTKQEITLPGQGDDGYQDDGDYDVYVLLLKGGKVSAPIKINTKVCEVEVNLGWDADYMVEVPCGEFQNGEPGR